MKDVEESEELEWLDFIQSSTFWFPCVAPSLADIEGVYKFKKKIHSKYLKRANELKSSEVVIEDLYGRGVLCMSEENSLQIFFW